MGKGKALQDSRCSLQHKRVDVGLRGRLPWEAKMKGQYGPQNQSMEHSLTIGGLKLKEA